MKGGIAKSKGDPLPLLKGEPYGSGIFPLKVPDFRNQLNPGTARPAKKLLQTASPSGGFMTTGTTLTKTITCNLRFDLT